MIRVIVVGDLAAVRRGLVRLIGSEAGMEVVGEAASGQEAMERAGILEPDVVVLDLQMPRVGGLETVVALKGQDPDARILVLASFCQDDQIFPAIKAGASGFLLKDSPPEDLLEAIRQAYQGEAWLHPTIARKLVRELARAGAELQGETSPTAQEMEVLRLVARGLTDREIGQMLPISEGAVRSCIARLLHKLHTSARVRETVLALCETDLPDGYQVRQPSGNGRSPEGLS